MPRILRYLFLIACGVAVLLGLLIHLKHPLFWWETVPDFDAVFGFLGCILIVLISKMLGKYWLQKDEDYYD
ncbi:MAG: hypothetical protein P8Y09_01765 [Deltaproteobacteria bacterium]|jgi:hypothetical protein